VDEAFEVAQVAGEEARQNDSVVEVDSKVEGGKDAAKTNDP
jgi:hypothetical protein